MGGKKPLSVFQSDDSNHSEEVLNSWLDGEFPCVEDQAFVSKVATERSQSNCDK